MKSWWWILMGALLTIMAMAQTNPAPSPQTQQAIRGMKLVPQWHCLRYRKFDMVRRCRNYRAGRRY